MQAELLQELVVDLDLAQLQHLDVGHELAYFVQVLALERPALADVQLIQFLQVVEQAHERAVGDAGAALQDELLQPVQVAEGADGHVGHLLQLAHVQVLEVLHPTGDPHDGGIGESGAQGEVEVLDLGDRGRQPLHALVADLHAPVYIAARLLKLRWRRE